jgi:L-threonylcarbamoyladenylate synthase
MAVIGTDIETAKNLLEEGELVAIPTETVYGLAGNALNEQAVLKIFEAKNRPTFDPLIVHVKSKEQIHEFAESQGEALNSFLDMIWPGPVTILLPKKENIPDVTTSGLNTVALRMPDHPLTLELLSLLPFPLAAPSANPFGYISPTTPEHVQTGLGGTIRYILDGGPSQVGIESTIIEVGPEEIVVHRLGGMEQHIIKDHFPKHRLKLRLNQSSNPVAPGMLSMHYAPKVDFIATRNITNELKKNSKKKTVAITFSSSIGTVENNTNFVLSRTGDLAESARNLFKVMRLADELQPDVILAEFVPDMGLGKAINDRLLRASSKK